MRFLQGNGSRFGVQHTGDGLEGGGFARPIRADEADDLALVHRERDALERMDIAIVGMDIREF
jgi:hypothetical protein